MDEEPSGPRLPSHRLAPIRSPCFLPLLWMFLLLNYPPPAPPPPPPPLFILSYVGAASRPNIYRTCAGGCRLTGTARCLRQVCLSRDTHEWGADRLNDMRAKWDPTPDHMILMDVKVSDCVVGEGVVHRDRARFVSMFRNNRSSECQLSGVSIVHPGTVSSNVNVQPGTVSSDGSSSTD